MMKNRMLRLLLLICSVLQGSQLLSGALIEQPEEVSDYNDYRPRTLIVD